MTDRALNVSLGCAAACVLWVATVTLLLVGWLVDDDWLGKVGLATSAAAATATIRSYFVRQNRLLKTAFELVHDDARSSVRRMR